MDHPSTACNPTEAEGPNLAQAAKILDVSPQSVRLWVRQGVLVPAANLGVGRGRGLRFRAEDVEALRVERARRASVLASPAPAPEGWGPVPPAVRTEARDRALESARRLSRDLCDLKRALITAGHGDLAGLPFGRLIPAVLLALAQPSPG